MWRIRDARTSDEQFSQPFLLSEIAGALGTRGRGDFVGTVVSRLGRPNDRFREALNSVPTWLALIDDVAGLDPEQGFRLLRAGQLSVDIPNGPALDISIDDEFVVFSKDEGVEELVVEYEADNDFPPDRNTVVYFDFHGILGTNSVEVDGSEPLEPKGAIRKALAYLGFKAGALVGRAVRVTLNRPVSDRHDPFFERTLEALEKMRPGLAKAIPRLPVAASYYHSYLPQAGQIDQLTVLVHGTMSCGMRMAGAIFPSDADMPAPATKRQIFRFEHDTFADCQSNTIELTKRLMPYAELVPNVLLLAHSRGGLVAGGTAIELINRSKFKTVSLQTFGTPHAGTPFVTVVENAGKVVTALAKTGAKVGAKTFGADDTSAAALGWVSGLAVGQIVDLPPGIKDMAPGQNSYLNIALGRDYSRCAEAFAWAGEFNPSDKNADGFWHAMKLGFQKEIFDPADTTQSPHDGVVPRASALASTLKAQPPHANCDHSAFFDRMAADLRKRISQ
jgi:hypothetical protein